MILFFVFCIVFVGSVIGITVSKVRDAMNHPASGSFHGRPKTLWEEEEEDSIA